ncbi:MAG: DUF4810 domain-containing protein [Cytophagaceae bacterium]|jgi:hypothetical protein|nr:DUF4810 domain-containing protein [Henriciella sp.]MAZ25453.1 DUF4810 domain-containing protein [Cytophagaceae bacterium]|tara:strand:+ start:825 stop:1169 length:345 start_codon:yes stop_codon:yes gene_type:complete
MFEYGSYESSLYTYYKKPDMREKFRTSLEKAIEKGEQTDRLAPGLYAELGYLYLQDGDVKTATAMFEREAAAFPESRYFMTSINERLGQAPSEQSSDATSSDEVDGAAPADAGI